MDSNKSRRLFLANGISIGAGAGLVASLPSTSLQKVSGGESAVEVELRASRFLAAPDGRQREVWGYNHAVPGPLLRAKEGETIRVRVVNELPAPTSIHWHGFRQRGTPKMDGVEGVSREPILPDESFVYEFVADPAGTHWYHSHVGVQYGNGLFGSFVVEERTPIATYDRDEALLINDWFRESGNVLLARLLNAPVKGAMAPMKKMAPRPAIKEMELMGDVPGMANKASGGMPKDMKMRDVGDVPFQSGLINGKGRAPGTKGPLTTLDIGDGETLRLRLINGSSTYAFRFQIDNHPLTVIAGDGSPMVPVVVDSLVFAPGERYDVIVRGRGRGVYWIRAVTLDGNEIRAVLRAGGEQHSEPEPSPVRWGPRLLAPEAMRSPLPVNLANAAREVPLDLGGSMKPYRWTIGGQVYPKADPIVVRRGESIRFVFRNPTGMDHPFHLHGHSFHVLGKPGALNMKDPALKDTVNVPAKSDLVVQWLADNPGRWFFHCHIEWHMATGMARVIEVKPD